MAPIIVAGGSESNPVERIVDYVTDLRRTVSIYDLGGQGDPCGLMPDEIVRTRIIRSRISNDELDWFIQRAAGCGPLWRAVPADANLADADPNVHGGLYDDMLALFDHFAEPAEPGIAYGKISKVLHLKRPHLYPILDSQLRAAYRPLAAVAARRYQQQRPGVRWSYWAAVREDLLNPANKEALRALRCDLQNHKNDLVRRAGELSDIRLLDMLTWR